MKKLLLAAAALSVFATPSLAATVNFSSFATGTVLSNQVAGLNFTVSGGPATGSNPVVAQPFGSAPVGLSNGTLFGNSTFYPTFAAINIAFATGASAVSFTFNNFGDNSSFAPSTYSAFDSANALISTGNIGSVNSYGLVNVTGSGIAKLVISNGSNGNYSWLYGVGELNYTPSVSGVPEPASWAFMLAGFGMAGAAMRRRAKVSVTYA